MKKNKIKFGDKIKINYTLHKNRRNSLNSDGMNSYWSKVHLYEEKEVLFLGYRTLRNGKSINLGEDSFNQFVGMQTVKAMLVCEKGRNPFYVPLYQDCARCGRHDELFEYNLCGMCIVKFNEVY